MSDAQHRLEEPPFEQPPEDPPETARYLSWSALRFIHAPSVRMFQWTTLAIAGALIVSVVLSLFIQMDVSIEAGGEIISDMGVRDALVPTEGLLTRVLKEHGDLVEAGEVIATMDTDSASQPEMSALITELKDLAAAVEAEAGAPSGDTPAPVPRFRPAPVRILDPSVVQALAAVEQAYRAYSDQKEFVATGLRKELAPLNSRIQALTAKLATMKSSRRRDVLGVYIESTTDELARLQTQVLSVRNAGETRLRGARDDLLKAARIAQGQLEGFVKQRQIRSPVKGIIARLHLGPNTYARANTPVATIIPEGAKFVGQLRVHSKDIAGVRVGQQVLYKVEAYPYQRFGLFAGEVQSFDSVKESAESAAYDDFAVRASIRAPEALPAELRKKLSFVTGMRFKASVVTDRKTISQILRERIFGH